ncbi:MAG: hypothetical protein ABDH20_13195 [Thermus sp.]
MPGTIAIEVEGIARSGDLIAILARSGRTYLVLSREGDQERTFKALVEAWKTAGDTTIAPVEVLTVREPSGQPAF